jgi:hypothetical protein
VRLSRPAQRDGYCHDHNVTIRITSEARDFDQAGRMIVKADTTGQRSAVRKCKTGDGTIPAAGLSVTGQFVIDQAS